MSRAWRRSLFVKIETTPNPDSLKFLPEDRIVLPEAMGSGLHFSDVGDARGSKLVRQLLKVKEITGVFLGRDFLSVNKVEAVSWTVRRGWQCGRGCRLGAAAVCAWGQSLPTSQC